MHKVSFFHLCDCHAPISKVPCTCYKILYQLILWFYNFSGDNIVIITDPPFGGRTEPIALTFQTINEIYQKLNQRNDNIPMFWIYPYFMETHICLTNLGFTMLDYIVEYENHGSFGNGPKARKLGSPVRIFTTVNPRYSFYCYRLELTDKQFPVQLNFQQIKVTDIVKNV